VKQLSNSDGLINKQEFAETVVEFNKLYQAGDILAASAISEFGLLYTLQDMGLVMTLLLNSIRNIQVLTFCPAI